MSLSVQLNPAQICAAAEPDPIEPFTPGGLMPNPTPVTPMSNQGVHGTWQMLFQQLPTSPRFRQDVGPPIGHIGNLLLSYTGLNKPGGPAGSMSPNSFQTIFSADAILPQSSWLLDPENLGLPLSGLPGLTPEHEFFASTLRHYGPARPLQVRELQQYLHTHWPAGFGPTQVGRNLNAVSRMGRALHGRYPQHVTMRNSAGGPFFGWAA